MGQPQETRIVMMVILETGAKGRRHRQPLADVHGIVVLVVIASISMASRVRPIVLNHVYPQRENSHADPHCQRKFPISSDEPQEGKAEHL